MRIGRSAITGAFSAAVFSTNVDRTKLSCPIEVQKPWQKESDVLISRKIVNHCDKSNLQLRLFQYQACPFCCKVRAFLDYYGFAYEVVEVNPVTKSEIKFSKDYKKVPILSTNVGTLTDSTLIISQLASFLRDSKRKLSDVQKYYPIIETVDDKNKLVQSCPQKYVVFHGGQRDEDIAEDREERQWREWVDSRFIHLISPNVYRTFDESLETFKWFSEFGEWDRLFTTSGRAVAIYVGAFIMWMVSKRLKRRHNIDDERKSMAEAFEQWMDAIGPNREYMGGSSPNLADLGMYGAMTAFSGCRAFKDLVADGSAISLWFNRMRKAVENHEGRHLLEQYSTAVK